MLLLHQTVAAEGGRKELDNVNIVLSYHDFWVEVLLFLLFSFLLLPAFLHKCLDFRLLALFTFVL